jgi:hypothetical protein
MLDRVHPLQPTPRERRLLLRLCLFAFCGGLLLLLSSRPAEAAERQEPKLLDPVRTTLKATAREVDSFAGRATGSGSSTVAKAAHAAGQVATPATRKVATPAARQVATPHPRPATGGPRPAATPTVKRGAPAVTSPVRRAAPSTHPATPATKSAARSAHATARPVTGITSVLLERAAKPEKPAAGSVKGVLAPVVGLTGPVLRPLGSAVAPVGTVLAPLGSALAPVGSALAPVVGPVSGLLPSVVPGGLLPLPGLAGSGSETSAPAGSGTHGPAASVSDFEGTSPASSASSLTTPARPAADGASSPAARSIRSWPALTGAVSLPGFPASAELPAGGPDPLSTSSGAGFGLAALAAALVLLGPIGRGLARPDGSGVISRSYLPLVSPA